LFFTVANPGMKYSGAFLSSKSEISIKLPEELVPLTLLIDQNTSFKQCQDFINDYNLMYPLILKPDFGLRGIGIKLISSAVTLDDFISIKVHGFNRGWGENG